MVFIDVLVLLEDEAMDDAYYIGLGLSSGLQDVLEYLHGIVALQDGFW